jgi:uncharacterized protein YbaR (Trm112 family)
MPASAPPPFDLEGLACPRGCAGGALVAEEDGGDLRCPVCGRRYPLIGRIPCLVDDPSLWRAMALARLDEYLAANEARRRALAAEAALPHLLPLTRQRLTRVADALRADHDRLPALFADMKRGALVAPLSSVAPGPGPDQARRDLPLLKHYENLFRDWAWGDRESQRALDLVARLLPAPLGRVGVYGAGAGRLAVDVHRTPALGASRTFALDVNPLPLLAADRLIAGETLELDEYPVGPVSAADAVVRQTLRCAAPPPAGFAFLFADALHPPFAAGALDSVLTYWFVDAVPVDLRVTAAAINRVLRPGGTWINAGPLHFDTALSRFYTIDEARTIVADSGFALLSDVREDLPYFDSPHSGSRRSERVFGFAARKTGEAPPIEPPPPGASPAIPGAIPAWVADPTLPVPPTPELAVQARSSAVTAGVLSLVDGRRSIADIARQLGQSWGVEPEGLVNQLRALLARIAGG